MSDPVEIPLLGASAPVGDGAARRRPDRRRPLAPTFVAIVAIGIVVTIVVVAADEDGDEPAAGATTSIAEDGPVRAPAIDTLPPIPATSTVPSTVPALPRHPEVGVLTVDVEFDEGAFDLDTALRRADDDRPRRGLTSVAVGSNGFRLDVEISRAAGRDRYRLFVDGVGRPVELIVDLREGSSYMSIAQGDWQRLPNEEVLDRSTDELDAFLDRMLLGPVRSDTVADASVTPGPYVLLAGQNRIARRYDIVLDAADAPDWSRYGLGPTAAPPGAGAPFTIAAYVDEWGDLVQVDGVIAAGTTEQLSQHAVAILPAAHEIPLPDEVATPRPQRRDA